MPRTRKKKPAPAVRPGIDTLVPAAREKALELAKGDTKRVEVVSPTEAIVR